METCKVMATLQVWWPNNLTKWQYHVQTNDHIRPLTAWQYHVQTNDHIRPLTAYLGSVDPEFQFQSKMVRVLLILEGILL